MKKSILAIFTLLFSISVYAVPANKDSLEYLFNIHQKKTLEYLFLEKSEEMGQQISKEIILKEKAEGALTLEKEELLGRFGEKLSAKILPVIVATIMPILQEEFIQIYSENFSQEEVDSLIAFYSTTKGQRIIEKTVLNEEKISNKFKENLASPAMELKFLEAMQAVFLSGN